MAEYESSHHPAPPELHGGAAAIDSTSAIIAQMIAKAFVLFRCFVIPAPKLK